jgi:hypothetical protein
MHIHIQFYQNFYIDLKMLKKNTTDKIFKVVFVRHGESTWNNENRFTGWTDVSLTENGVKEAINAGQLLK